MLEKKYVGENIRQLREHKGISQKDLARMLTARGYKIAPNTLCGYERGNFLPKTVAIFEIADILGVKVDDLFKPFYQPAHDVMEYTPQNKTTKGTREIYDYGKGLYGMRNKDANRLTLFCADSLEDAVRKVK